MTTTPAPEDPQGGTAPSPDLAGEALLDGGADQADGSAHEDMADAASEGDERLRAAESTAGMPTQGDPQAGSASRADTAGGSSSPGQ